MVLRFTFLCYTTEGRVNVASFIFDVLLPNTWQKWPTSITIVVVRKLFDNRVDDKSLPGFHKKNIKLFQASFVVIEKVYNQNYGLI